ncbi:conserved hypothetical protein [Paraburkholderia piptadeniae]|uniref:Uncharacterized protein n=2 Tax=Paraburkholderia TaxID=1822464 RepID=A0A7X1TJN1_9BURK|nr:MULTISPECIES: hypothetical protein [Paraburkholderia]MPW21720.1 hypothetical protein [Paraburkholderia franconis]SIT51856.1 conserved hypothetical protein [Paraburkholderia piptadeniae]
MGASDDSIREELIGEVLGELSRLRRDVKELTQLLQASGKQFKDDGELTLLRFTSRYERFLKDFNVSTTGVLAEAGRFAEARDQLLGELALREYDQASGRVRGQLRDVLREENYCGGIGRLELAIWVVCAALGSAALSVGAITALHLIRA